jgi:hypothetical protein
MRILLESVGVAVLAMLVTVAAPSEGTAQIPNNGFETWNGGNPDSWFSSNILGVGTPLTASDTRHSGLLAAKGEVLSTSLGTVAPSLWSVFPQTQVPQRMQLYYQFAPLGGDVLAVTVLFYNGSTPIAVADTEIVAAAGAFTLLDLPTETVLPGTPASCQITISVMNNGGSGETVGTTFIIDDIVFSDSPTSVPGDKNVPAVFALNQNYPNPFNPSTTIEYALPEARQVRLEVFNAIGERVASLVDARQEGGTYRSTFDASALQSGVYLYRLSAGSDVSVKRMILMK